MHARLNETGNTSTNVEVSANAHSSILSEVDNLTLNVVASVVGDPTIHSAHRNNPANTDGTEDFTIGTLTLDSADRESFNFRVRNDKLIEGHEVVTLTLEESEASYLPPGWTISDEKYYIVIEANDNVARFAPWSRGNPGGVASLTPTVEDGSETVLLILLTHHTPVTADRDELPFVIEVEDGHENDIEIYRLDGRLDRFATNVADDGTLPVRGYPSPSVYCGSQTYCTPQPQDVPVVAAHFGLRAVSDGISEGREVITLKLREGRGFPTAWGSVRDVADTGTPAVDTSTTICLTIPAND